MELPALKIQHYLVTLLWQFYLPSQAMQQEFQAPAQILIKFSSV